MGSHDKLVESLLDLAVQIQQVPAPTLGEGKRAQLVEELFQGEGLADIQIDPAGNVVARLPGEAGVGKAKTSLLVSAHLDTVFPDGTELKAQREAGRITAPGIGDNSLGVAGLFGLVWRLRERGASLAGDVWLAANVGEEGLGNLRGMRELVERFGDSPRLYLVLEGMALGHIYHRGIGVRRYRITAKTEGGHSWTDYGKPSAIHELAGLVGQLAHIALPEQPKTTLNVGRIWGGTSVNTLAAEAGLELDLRSEKATTLNELVQRVDGLVRAANKTGVRIEADLIGERPAGSISGDDPLVRLAEDCLREAGFDPGLTGGSTDANLPLSRGYPALVLGLTTGGGAHTVHEYIDTEPLARGLESVVEFVCRVMGN